MLSIVYGPNKIFKQKAEEVTDVNDDIRSLVQEMLDVMYAERAVGIGANMVGILKRIAVVDLMINGNKDPIVLINPKITWKSQETQSFLESSLSFRGIDAMITRPRSIKVQYLDIDGVERELECSDFLATVIQHEVDYLDGIIFLDYLSKTKRDLLMTKMAKYVKNNPPHVHTSSCRH